MESVKAVSTQTLARKASRHILVCVATDGASCDATGIDHVGSYVDENIACALSPITSGV